MSRKNRRARLAVAATGAVAAAYLFSRLLSRESSQEGMDLHGRIEDKRLGTEKAASPAGELIIPMVETAGVAFPNDSDSAVQDGPGKNSTSDSGKVIRRRRWA